MDDGQRLDSSDPHKGDEEGNALDWLLRKESSEIIPMDTNVLTRPQRTGFGNCDNTVFTRERVFEAASQGDKSKLHGLLDYLQVNDKHLTSPEYIDKTNGKTALMKALLNLKDGKNDTIEVLLDIAEKTGDLEKIINTCYKDPYYKGQTALHIAIERRSLNHVKVLVQKGADVQAKANGEFFQRKTGMGFYFGELPLSLAACTNQLDIVSFLIKNNTRCDDKDSQGNTVLHALVVIADNEKENTDMFASIYDKILIEHNNFEKDRQVQLEAIVNNNGLTPLKLAAKLGKIGLFKHMLHREFKEENMKHLTRKFTEWVYGPVRSSLYDTTRIDTIEENSVLEIVVFGSDIPNRPEMLQLEPLRSILQDKWDRFASKLFLMNFLIYLVYLTIFTTVAYNRKEGQPPFPIEYTIDYPRCIGELISVFGAVWFFYKALSIFKRKRPNFKALYTDGFYDILFFLQALLLLICTVLYFCGKREYVGLLVLSLALAWINVLYYSRGSRRIGIYGVMIQKMILGDLLNFLSVYCVLLFGFSAAVVTLIEDSNPVSSELSNRTQNRGRSFGDEPFKCEKPSYNDIRFTLLELFKFTIGMGNLEFTDNVQYKEVFYILLLFYIVLTYILLLNMLIALMGNTVERISQESERIWNFQRAFTILDIERTLPMCLKSQYYSRVTKMVCFEQYGCRRFFRVEEMNWKQWRSDLGVIQKEDPGGRMMSPEPQNETFGNMWNLSPLLDRIRARRRPQFSGVF